MSLYRAGDVILTLYGVGVIVNVGGGSVGSVGSVGCNDEIRPNVLSNKQSAGTSVTYVVRLWRIPGKSIASSAHAYLNESCIRGKLPAAPGMITHLKDDIVCSDSNSKVDEVLSTDEKNQSVQQQRNYNNRKRKAVLIHCYYESRNIFVATLEDDEVEVNIDTRSLFEVSPSELVPIAKSAKIYPVLESLMIRAEKTAAAVQKNLQTTQHVVTKAGRVICDKIKTQAQSVTENADDMDSISAAAAIATDAVTETAKFVEKISNQVETQTLPSLERNIKEVLTIVKDEEITVLLEKCKNRLEALQNDIFSNHQSNTDRLSAQALETLERTAGIKLTLMDASDSSDDEDSDEHDDNKNKVGPFVTKDNNTAAIAAAAKIKKVKKQMSFGKSIRRSRKVALTAIQHVLKQAASEVINDEDRLAVQQELLTNFTNAFDMLQQTAKSDKVLSELFDTVSSKTTDWQQHTGRLMQTKSASLFLESATRFQARAVAIFGKTSIAAANLAGGGSNTVHDLAMAFTKSFTEGDAAIARLKSIELGQVVKDKLIRAIEIRSESQGGLDGIIAGALKSVTAHVTSQTASVLKGTNEPNNNSIQDLLQSLQQAATSVASNARETLITVISSQSQYRDLTLLRIEQTLCDLLPLLEEQKQSGERKDASLENYNEDEVSSLFLIDPEQIAAIVQGDGGTAQIFKPIAQHAMKQIEMQLDIAEGYIRNNNNSNSPLILEGLQRIRKLLSGELSVSAIMDEIVNVLNDDKVIAVGESLVQHGEQILDVLEGAATSSSKISSGGGFDSSNNNKSSSHKVVADALQMVEKAGITKDVVMRELDQLNVNELIGTAEQAVTDENARQQLISSATDAALDFLLKILPSMPVPPLDGVKDGLLYHISNLSMQGFKVSKENIQIDLAGIRATKDRHHRNQTKDPSNPRPTDDGYNDNGLYNDSGSKHKNTFTSSPGSDHFRNNTMPSSPENSSTKSTTGMPETPGDHGDNSSVRPIKATELLIIDIQEISATLDNAIWSFEQTYLPYLKRNGAVNVRMSGGAIRLQFELRKHRKQRSRVTSNGGNSSSNTSSNRDSQADDDNLTIQWEPVLCLHDRTCSIAEVDMALQGEGRITWILNKLVAIFKGVLRDYVVRTIVSLLSNQSGWILQRLNAILSPYWDLILRTANLTLDDLVEADDKVIVAQQMVETRQRIELVWRERLPLGLNLLMNDDSGLLKVVDFPRGSAARVVCEQRNLDPDLFKGSTIIAVNGRQYDDQDDLFEALKHPARPKTIQFELANSEEVQRLLEFVEGPKNQDKETVGRIAASKGRSFGFRRVIFTEPGPLGIEFGSSIDNAGLIVNDFLEGDSGTVLAAVKSHNVTLGDLLTHVNDEFVIGLNNGDDGRSRAIRLLETNACKRPLMLSFIEPYLHKVVIPKVAVDAGNDNNGGPSELVLNERQVAGVRRIYIEKFQDTAGMAESSGILIGDRLVFVNGLPVGVGCQWLGSPNPPTFQEVVDMLHDPKNYPIGLTFARPLQQKKKNAYPNMNSYSWNGNVSNNPNNTTGAFRDTDAETKSVMADSFERLGCVFEQQRNLFSSVYIDIVVADFVAVPGIFQRNIVASVTTSNLSTQETTLMTLSKKLSIESINGQFVPSYASVDMVKSALNRCWNEASSSSQDNVSSAIMLVLADDDLKEWLDANQTSGKK